ncbi:MAG: Hsp70 family protein [Deltaproteobacteria bacterium]|nr:MAG: Hsp70 family protein [Deltaproteobacteria bacterium]
MQPGSNREVVLGIDFGMSTVSACGFVGGKLHFVVDEGERAIPCAVYIPERSEPLVGRRALHQILRDPAATITAIKRLLGRHVHEREVRRLDAGVAYAIASGPDDMALLDVRGRQYAPQQVAGEVLRHIRQLAELRFGAAVRRAVVTVPATASPAYCQALKQAAQFAGLAVQQFVPEPVAGCLAHGMHETTALRRLAVCDFGGGTFDVTIITQDGLHFECLAIDGDDLLGGVDFDEELAEAVAGHLYQARRVDLHRDVVKWQELLWRAESVKRQLSTATRASLVMNDAFVANGQRHDLRLGIDRAWIEPRWAKIARRMVPVLDRALARARRTPDDIDEVLLIGGSTLMPIVRRIIGEYFGKPLRSTEHADVAVAVGAALQTGQGTQVCTQVPRLPAGAAP